MIPLPLLRLPSELLHLYAAIRSFDWQREGEGRAGCTASARTLAERIGKGERQTRDNLRRLEACGAVHLERQTGDAFRVLCTPERFDAAKLTPAVHRRTPQPRQSTAGGSGSPPPEGAAAGCRRVRQSTADEVETVSRDKKKRQKVEGQPRQSTAAVALPDYLPADLWRDFREMRQRIRKPMTPRAEALLLRDLEKLRGEGHDPRAVVEQSIKQSWQGLFPLRAEGRGGERRGRPAPRLGDDTARDLFDHGTDR